MKKLKKLLITFGLSAMAVVSLSVAGTQVFRNSNSALVSTVNPSINSTIAPTKTTIIAKGEEPVTLISADNTNKSPELVAAKQDPSIDGYTIAVPKDNSTSEKYEQIAQATGYLERYPQLASSEFAARDGQKVVKDAALAFDSMRAAARKDGISLKVLSGFRDIQTQVGIFKRKGANIAAANYSAPPGHSQHHTGLAMDLNSLSPSFRKSKEYRWLKANAPGFGFMLSYENDESHCDMGPHNEPWHWVFIGKPAARSLMEDFISRAKQCGYDPEHP